MTNKNKILEQNKNKIIMINCVVKDNGVWPQERKQGRFTWRAEYGIEDASPQTRGLNRLEILHHIVFLSFRTVLRK